MKKITKILFSIIILTISQTIFVYSQEFSFFSISKHNNPYPGYLNFDDAKEPGFIQMDNYSKFIAHDDVSEASGYFKVLKNGNIAQCAGDLYYIYDRDMVLIDSVLNPTDYKVDMHDFLQLRNGNYLLLLLGYLEMDLSEIVEGGNKHASILNNYLVETTGKGDIIWEWSAIEHYNILDVTEDIDLTQKNIDITHINTLEEDKNGNILVSVRHFDEISLINKSTGDFIWRMGGFKCKNNQFTFANDNNNGFYGFSHQHTTEFLENGNLLVFDNGNLKSPRYSRAVEYSIDYTNKKVTNVWEYRASPDLYTQAMGSAFRLPNGNTLISWSFGKIMEVKPDKTIALEIASSSPFPIYRAFKISPNSRFVKQKVVDFKEYNFNETGNETAVSIKINNASKTGENFYVQKHNYAPSRGDFKDSVFTSILPYRWVLSTDYDSFAISGTIKFNLTNLTGFGNPNKILVFKRSKEDTGIFERLETQYNSSKNEISAEFNGFGEFVLVSIDLGTPILSAPKMNAYTKKTDKLNWNKVIGATNYNILIATNQDFGESLLGSFDTDSLSYSYIDLSYNTKYFWKVRAYNNWDTSSWSEVYTFSTEIESPRLISPEDKIVGVKINSIMKWSAVEEANKYQFQISPYYNFIISNLIDTFTTKTEYNFYNLSYNLKYFVRFRAVRGSDSSSWSETYEFTTVLPAPNLTVPENNEVNVTQEYLFKWSYVPDAKSYRLQLSDKSDFSAIIVDKNVINDTENLIEDLHSNTKYYWRTKAKRDTDSSDWSEVFQFTTVLDMPVLVYPQNQQNSVEVNPLLKWNGSNDFDYHIQLAENLENQQFTIDTIVSNIAKFQIAELKPNTSYEWTVRTISGESNSPWSEKFTFKTNNAGNFLVPPILTFPLNNSEVSLPISLVWNRRVNAAYYRVQVSKSSTFSVVDIDEDIETLNYKITELAENVNYYWRVKAISLYDSSAWSEIFSFKVEESINFVTLSFPINNELQVPRTGILRWRSVLGANYYNIQLASDEQFNDVLTEGKVSSGDSFNYNGLGFNTQYYWRVQFSKDGETSDWSDAWTFRTVSTRVLETPKIIIPKANEAKVTIKGIMAWNLVTDAKSYVLSISTLNDKTTYIYKQNNANKSEIEYDDLEYETTYYVKIAAFNDTASSLWSDPIIFITELQSPNITSPVDKSKNLEDEGIIEWEIVGDGVGNKYNIQISKDRDFEEIVVDEDEIHDLYYNYKLELNQTYFARVRRYSEINASEWSSFIRFNTDTLATSINLSLSYDRSIYPNPASEYIMIDYDGDISSKMKIYDIHGNTKLISTLNFGKNMIDIRDLSAGTYFANINDKIYKFIIKH